MLARCLLLTVSSVFALPPADANFFYFFVDIWSLLSLFDERIEACIEEGVVLLLLVMYGRVWSQFNSSTRLSCLDLMTYHCSFMMWWYDNVNGCDI